MHIVGSMLHVGETAVGHVTEIKLVNDPIHKAFVLLPRCAFNEISLAGGPDSHTSFPLLQQLQLGY